MQNEVPNPQTIDTPKQNDTQTTDSPALSHGDTATAIPARFDRTAKKIPDGVNIVPRAINFGKTSFVSANKKPNTPIRDALRDELGKPDPDNPGFTVAQTLARKLIQTAKGKDRLAYDALMSVVEQSEGRIPAAAQGFLSADGAHLALPQVSDKSEAMSLLLGVLDRLRDRQGLPPQETPKPAQGTVLEASKPPKPKTDRFKF